MDLEAIQNDTNFNNTSSSNQIESIAMISAWSTSLLVELIFLFVIIKSKSNLVPVEYLILLEITSGWFSFKMVIIYNYISGLISSNDYSFFKLLLSQWLFGNASFLLSMFMIYYSVYHVSTLTRSPLFLKLFYLVRRKQTLLVFTILVAIYSITFTTVSYITVYQRLEIIFSNGTTKEAWSLYQTSNIHLVILQSLTPPFVTSSIYFIGVIVIFKSWISDHRSYATKSTNKRFKRNLVLIVKFLFLSLGICLFISCKIVVYISSLYTKSDLLMRCINYIGDFLLMFFQVFLLFIHKILLKTFRIYLRKVFCSKSKM